jgi:GntR family transcriptional repressor for pyruvate dehydrogenase complex
MFEPITEGGIPESIVRQLKRLISTGRLKPGDRLPGERELRRQLEVSRSSIRQALQALEATGYVKVIPGRGTFIQTPSEKTGLLMESMISPWVEGDGKLLRELLEVRSILEAEAASLAAERASQDDLARIHAELENIVKAHSSRLIQEMVSANIAFHRSIALATGNSLMVTLTDSIGTAMRDLSSFAIRLSGGLPDSVEEHRRIYNAIAAGDPSAARAEAEYHIKGVSDLLKLYLSNVDGDLTNADVKSNVSIAEQIPSA